MLLKIAFVCAIASMKGHSAGAVECYTCTNTSSLSTCTTIVQCSLDSACYSEYVTIQGIRFFTLGCRNMLSCPVRSTVSSMSSIVGRRAAAVNTNCSECCLINHCNRQLCQDPDEDCADDTNYSCANVGSVMDVCAESSHMKPYCKRFCGFCNTVDGGWSHWGEWGNCDVTCNNGSMTKLRTCTDPPPANGGSDCVGEKQAHTSCSKSLCPVHGGWSQWSEWGYCSVTCDVGLQRRDRSCSNPYPARYGDHCYGDSRSDRLCFQEACNNGSWSSWSSWGSCDKTCDGGVKTRTRDCDNPAPSLTGKYCSGEATEAETCNILPCQGPVVFFAKGVLPLSPGVNAKLRFTTVITNVGHGYDNSTGVFTAPVNGAYSFGVQFCVANLKTIGVDLIVNNASISDMYAYGDAAEGCRSMFVPVALTKGDHVYVKTGASVSKGQVLTDDVYRMNSFSGTLVH